MLSTKQGAKSLQGVSFLLLVQRPPGGRLHKAASPPPAFPGRGGVCVENTIASTTTLVRFLPTTQSHHLHLLVAKWHKTKGINEKISLMKAPYSHYPTLLSSECIFSEENPFEDGTKSTWRLYDTEQRGELYYKLGITEERWGGDWEISY